MSGSQRDGIGRWRRPFPPRRWLSVVAAPGIVLALLTSPLPASAQSAPGAPGGAAWNALYDRIIRLEHEVRALRRDGATAGGGVTASAGASPRLEGRLKALEAELADLRRLMRRRLDDFDRRLRALERRRGARLAPSVTPPAASGGRAVARGTTTATAEKGLPPAVNPDDLRRDPDLFAGAGPRMSARIERPAGSAAGRGGGERLLGRLRVDERGRPLPSDTAAPRAPATPGAARPLPGVPTRLRATPPADTANGAAPLVPERVEAVPLPAPETKMARADADGLLERARNDFLARRYDRAAAAYRDFLQRAQGHPARADATFELGETYYLQGRYREAGKAYLDTYRKFPASRVASQALFKLGMSLKRLGQKKQACRTWKLLRDRYAASRPARLLAPREMKRAGCRG